MIEVTFQVSLYPLSQKNIHTPIDEFINELMKRKLKVKVHETSTIGSGDLDSVLDSIKRAYTKACEHGEAVMVLTISNSCPTFEELHKLNEPKD
ncbi:MAG: YkoF family thiamine/hydroxymethylpyrimidine-binding protein [Candidatus Kryptoniota bacterium]